MILSELKVRSEISYECLICIALTIFLFAHTGTVHKAAILTNDTILYKNSYKTSVAKSIQNMLTFSMNRETPDVFHLLSATWLSYQRTLVIRL